VSAIIINIGKLSSMTIHCGVAFLHFFKEQNLQPFGIKAFNASFKRAVHHWNFLSKKENMRTV